MTDKYLVSPLPILAATIVLSSSGAAAEWVGDMMGEFVREGVHKGRPYYKQRDTEGKDNNILYSR